MNQATHPIPEGHGAVTAYLIVGDAVRAIEFYSKVFNGRELFRYQDGDRVGHAELAIGNGRLMLADAYPEMGYTAPAADSPKHIALMLYVEDVDNVFRRAIDAGAKPEREVADQPYGDRNGGFIDPFGHRWYIATHIEDPTPEEIRERMAAR